MRSVLGRSRMLLVGGGSARFLVWLLAFAAPALAQSEPSQPGVSVQARFEGGESRPQPTFRIESKAARQLDLTVCVPSGWSLYAPELPDHPAGGVGLPLRILVGEKVLHPTSWPPPASRATVLGPGWVHEAGCFGASVEAPGEAQGVTELVFRWALCQDGLCVPGRSAVAVPGNAPSPTTPSSPG